MIFTTVAGISSPFWGSWLIWKRRLSTADRQNRTELDRRRERYESIVQEISSLKLKQPIGSPIYFEIATDRDPATLRLCDRGESHLKVDALRKEGRLIEVTTVQGLKARFITTDFGLRGVFSLTYTIESYAPGEQSGEDCHVTQIDPHWQASYIWNPRNR